MSAVECPPTPPTLPEGDAALTPPPKSLEKSDSDESLAKSVSQRRPSSPDHDAKCAICLGNLDNLSHTDKCYHKFCFICLKEWSKVKAECPLCKTKFKSIIHTIKSDGKSEQFDLPPPPPRPEVGELHFFLTKAHGYKISYQPPPWAPLPLSYAL